jgi:hypothetical protein
LLNLNDPEVDGAASVGAAVAAGADVAAGAAVAAGADVAAGAAVAAAIASVGSGVAVAEAPQATISNRAPTIAMRIPNRRFLNHLAVVIFSHLSEMRQYLVVEQFNA